MLRASLYYSVRSPYSYLAIGRYRELTRDYDLSIRLLPVYPIAIRNPEFFKHANPHSMTYVRMDTVRIAEQLGIPFIWPDPDPIVQDLETREIAAEQPHIHRITRLVQLAAREARGLDFAAEVAGLVWGGTKDWHQGDHLANAAAELGLDFQKMEADAAACAQELDAEIANNEASLDKAGHWGVPTLVFEGEPFFGQDRIEAALWRMKQAGLKAR